MRKLRLLVIFIVILAVVSISVCYSAFGSDLSVSNIVAEVRVTADIRVTEFSYLQSVENGLSSYEDYNINSLLTSICLPKQNSTVTYKVEVTNFSNAEMGIFEITNLPSNLTYEITDYSLQDKICDTTGKCSLGAVKDFYITIKYTDSGYNADVVDYNLNLKIDFRRMYTITYEGITNNNYPTQIIDGGDINITFTSPIPAKVVPYINNEKVSSYSYSNNVLTVDDVNSDILLKYQAKAYITLLGEGKYFKEAEYLTAIKSVEFVDSIDTVGVKNALATYDLSVDKDGSIIAWIDSDYKLYIGSEWKIYATHLASAFSGMTNVESILFNNLNTSEVYMMYNMFYNCNSLKSLDLSSFNTKNVTSMNSMFYNCSSISVLDLSHFDTSNVSGMVAMFYNMSSLTSLDISSFNTGKVTTMQSMFDGCSSITELDLGSFNTESVTSMYGMFYNCNKLTELDLSHFDTSNVTSMGVMFYANYALGSLNISGFDTSSVTSMAYMFAGLRSLTSLDVRHFDTTNVTAMEYMFFEMRKLTSLDVSNFDTSKVTNMKHMFEDMRVITKLDLSNFDTAKVTQMHNMFANSKALTEIIFGSKFTTNATTTMYYMFQNLINITSLDLTSFNTNKVTDMSYMFSGTTNLTEVLVSSGWDTTNVTDFTNMFMGSGISEVTQV